MSCSIIARFPVIRGMVGLQESVEAFFARVQHTLSATGVLADLRNGSFVEGTWWSQNRREDWRCALRVCVRTRLGISVFAMSCLGFPVLAMASCPRLASGASEMANLLSFQESVARIASKDGTVSDTKMWEAYTSGAIKWPPLGLFPLNGPAPLTVVGRWSWHPVEEPVAVEFDADGDGRPEISGRDYGQLRHTYAVPGRFTATATVRDREGRVRTHATVVTVVPLADFDAGLQARWNTLKAALRAGNIDAAVECLHSRSRARYREIFTTLFASEPRKVDDTLTSIRFVEQNAGRAVYEMLRSDDGKRHSYQVLFQIDADDVWRLASF